MPPPCALARSKLHAPPALPPPAAGVLRTAEDRFEALPGYRYAPKYADVADAEKGDPSPLLMAYIDEGERAGDLSQETLLCLHGEPSWGFIFRKMVPHFLEAGHRVVVPDLIGFGRSDKPAARSVHRYASHCRWMGTLLAALGLRRVTLVAQDWGGLIGLRLAGRDVRGVFVRASVSNTVLPDGRFEVQNDFREWQRWSQGMAPMFDAGEVLQLGTQVTLSDADVAAYRAPFPSEEYCAGPREMPMQVPAEEGDAEAPHGRELWDTVFSKLTGFPFQTAFGGKCKLTPGYEKRFIGAFPGCRHKGVEHAYFPEAGHFTHEDAGTEWAAAVLAMVAATPLPGYRCAGDPRPAMCDVLRTPEARFAGLAKLGYTFEPKHITIGEGTLRMAYLDEGARPAETGTQETVLCLHGEPTWGFLYRKMIPVLVAAGLRVVVPDNIGFGRSDKLAERSAHTFAAHSDWMEEFVRALDLRRVTVVGQDWGAMFGLRLIAEDHLGRFTRLSISNAGFPNGIYGATDSFKEWRAWSQAIAPPFDAGAVVQKGTASDLPEAVCAAYNAPFPTEQHASGARQFPMNVPFDAGNPECERNRKDWWVLMEWTKPWQVAYGAQCTLTRGYDRVWMARIPGAQTLDAGLHRLFERAGHFTQEDCGEEWAAAIVRLVRETPLLSDC